MFQTLIGTVKTRFRRPRRRAALAVSNPHRYGQNWSGTPSRTRGRRVSNPHRYGQNHHLYLGVFPVLRVSNPHRYGQNEGERRKTWATRLTFQTLIGTVKTWLRSSIAMGLVRFQTLIGTVKTASLCQARAWGLRVSNPHRYGQNALTEEALKDWNRGFKPS